MIGDEDSASTNSSAGSSPSVTPMRPIISKTKSDKRNPMVDIEGYYSQLENLNSKQTIKGRGWGFVHKSALIERFCSESRVRVWVWDWTGSIPTLTTGFVLVGLIRQDWNRSLQENQFSIETREKAMKVNADESTKTNQQRSSLIGEKTRIAMSS